MAIEHWIARSVPGDTTVNTVDLYPGPRLAVLELLDSRDSDYFRKYLLKRLWLEITPAAHRSGKTYYWTKPKAEELGEFESTVPDWFYISGHYARTMDIGKDGRILTPLPAGFFNEPFHKAEWLSAWGKQDPASLFLQTETFDEDIGKKFKAYLQKQWYGTPYGPGGPKKKEAGQDGKDAIIDEWLPIWQEPSDDTKLQSTTVEGSRSLLTGFFWDGVKLVLLIGCNTLTWSKSVFLDVFPDALVLGYLGKNPANGTPHIKAFLKNVYREVSSPRDAKLTDHEYLARAWMDVHHKQKLSKSDRLAYMLPNGKVFGIGQGGETEHAGSASQVIFRASNGHISRWDNPFGYVKGDAFSMEG